MIDRILVAALALVAAGSAAASCPRVEPVPCPHCFAVFVMPDTQEYTVFIGQPEQGNHLDLVTRYVCAHREAWVEPRTGKQMPILMLIHLGDLVQGADMDEPNGGGRLAQWKRLDAAFDNLDACEPPVPYLVTVGNHDIVGASYEGESVGYDTYFGTDRWTSRGYGCEAPDRCAWSEGRWFLGGGDTIAANSRNRLGPGAPGPARDVPGRHRAALIEAPNGQPFLFLGLELAFDFPPKASPQEGDDLAWPRRTLDLHPDAATIVFHHSLFWAFRPPDTRLRWGPETWGSDSLRPPRARSEAELGTSGGMQAVYDALIAPRPQVRFVFTGHVTRPAIQADYAIPRARGGMVWGFLRNYQGIGLGVDTRGGGNYGAGWNAIAVFDPDAGEVRVRSYRIDDEEAYAKPPVNLLHAGRPVPTECMDKDLYRFPERVVRWDFTVAKSPR